MGVNGVIHIGLIECDTVDFFHGTHCFTGFSSNGASIGTGNLVNIIAFCNLIKFCLGVFMVIDHFVCKFQNRIVNGFVFCDLSGFNLGFVD